MADLRTKSLADRQSAFKSQILKDQISGCQNQIDYTSYSINIIQTPMMQVTNKIQHSFKLLSVMMFV